MQYKCVPAPKNLVIDSDGNHDDAVRSFADIINRESQNGWKYLSMENIAVTQNPGCLGVLFGHKAITTYFNMLIFYNESLQNVQNDRNPNVSLGKALPGSRYTLKVDNIESENDGNVSIPDTVELTLGENENVHESDVVDSISVIDNKWRCGECNNINEMYMVACSKCGKLLKTE